MAVSHLSRAGKTYYLNTGPKRGGGVQYFFSTKSNGKLVESVPEGFEVYENVGGQVFLRRRKPRLIRDHEHDYILRGIEAYRRGRGYRTEVRDKTLTIHQSDRGSDVRWAHYQAVFRFILVDPEQRLFAPERYCFRGSVDNWISVGPEESIEKLASEYLKHLGQDSMFDLY